MKVQTNLHHENFHDILRNDMSSFKKLFPFSLKNINSEYQEITFDHLLHLINKNNAINPLCNNDEDILKINIENIDPVGAYFKDLKRIITLKSFQPAYLERTPDAPKGTIHLSLDVLRKKVFMQHVHCSTPEIWNLICAHEIGHGLALRMQQNSDYGYLYEKTPGALWLNQSFSPELLTGNVIISSVISENFADLYSCFVIEKLYGEKSDNIINSMINVRDKMNNPFYQTQDSMRSFMQHIKEHGSFENFDAFQKFASMCICKKAISVLIEEIHHQANNIEELPNLFFNIGLLAANAPDNLTGVRNASENVMIQLYSLSEQLGMQTKQKIQVLALVKRFHEHCLPLFEHGRNYVQKIKENTNKYLQPTIIKRQKM